MSARAGSERDRATWRWCGAAAAIALALALGCGGSESQTPDAMVSALCLEATQHSDIEWLQTFVFTPGCASGRDCHNFRTPAAGLSLDIGETEAAVVGQPSTRVPGETLVIPGDPQNSHLMVTMGSYTGENPSGLMPPGAEPLCIEMREAVERWIAALPTSQ